ncbi:unnamed protein product, partial [Brenthis ino]
MASEKQNGATTDIVKINIDSSLSGKNDTEMADNQINISKEKPQNGNFTDLLQVSNDKDQLGVPRHGHRMSFMEEESVKDKIRLSLLKQCSAILKQGDQRYSKETLHRAFQDEDLLERIFRLFDVERQDHLVQEDWFEFLKERLREEKQLDFVEQVESVAYVLCGDGDITLDTFQSILKNKVVINKLLKVVDTDGDGHVTADEVMEFISAVSSCRPYVGIDKLSVARLEQLFRETAGDEKEITREQFQKIVVSKNPFFTERVFQIFDEDNSGTISHHEFIEAVHRFGHQTPEDKIRFLFKVYDLDGDGLIQQRELQHVLRACMLENGMQFSDAQLAELAAAMLEDAGALTYEALRDQLARHEGLLENLSISIDRWLVPPTPEPEPTSLYQRLRKMKPYQLSLSYFRNNYVYVSYLMVFFAINVGLFAARVVEYWLSNVFVIFARACGQCLNFTCTWLLVLMLRRSMTALRALPVGALLPLDHHVYLHKLTGVLVLAYSAVHAVMHICNFTLVVVYDPELNPRNLTAGEWLCTVRPGVLGLCAGCANPTGLALAAALLGLALSSRPALRHGGCFEIFYFAHLLYIPFYILLILHAPNFWKWFLVPGVIYIIEKTMKLAWMRSGRGKTYAVSGALLPSRVTHVVLRRPPHFDFRAGDYVFVNVPAVALYEWHPFTISSAPEHHDYLWLHIRGVGEWTNRLYAYFEEQQRRAQAADRHEKESRRGSALSCRSRRKSSSSKKRSVDFSPFAYANDAFTIEEETKNEEPAASPPPLLSRPSFLSPLRLLEKSRSMPDVRSSKKRIHALHEYHRSESTFTLPEGRRDGSGGGVSGGAGGVPGKTGCVRGGGGAALSLAHSFRYMRTKPPIIACKPPSEERRRSNESILSIARRRLSKSISPDKDDVNEKPDINIESPSDAPEESDDNYHITRPLEVYLDGPYGAPSSHIFRASHAVLVAAGIGVTPFASLLQTVMLRHRAARRRCLRCAAALPPAASPGMNLKKVDFFWINREQRSFEWFVSLLSQLEMEQAEDEALAAELEEMKGKGEGEGEGQEDKEKAKENSRFLEMHMYITSALQKSDMKAVGLQLALDLLHEKEKRDLITGLKTRTNAGRPNWDKVFQRVRAQRRGAVTVFYCGPPALGRELRRKAARFGFGFRKEVF